MSVSAIDRLRNVPDVFTLSRLASVSGVDRKHATVLLARWTEAGFARPAGPRSGVYYNLLARREITAEMKGTACEILYPSAVLTGESVLRNAGWTTQIPANINVAVLSRRTYAKLDGFEITGRPKAWFVRVHPSIIAPREAEFSTYGLRTLPPALALADLYAREGAWRPDEDDLDIEPEQAVGLAEAFGRLGVEPPDFLIAASG
jgi:hypothetical protein